MSLNVVSWPRDCTAWVRRSDRTRRCSLTRPLGFGGFCIGVGWAVVASQAALIAAIIAAVALAATFYLLIVRAERVPSTYLACVLAAMVGVPALRVGHAGARPIVAYAVAGGSTAILLLGVARTFRATRGGRAPLALLGGVLAVGAVATSLQHDHGAWQRLGLTFGFLLAVAVVASAASARERDRCLRLIVYVAATEAVVAVVGWLTRLGPLWVGARIYAGGISRPLPDGLLGHERQQGTLGHPLPLALLLSIAWAMVVASPTLMSPVRRRLFLVLLAGGVVVTMTVSVLALMPVAYFVFRPNRGGALPRAVLVGLGIGAVALTLFSAGDVSVRLTESGSYTHRLGALQAAKRLILHQPFARVVFGNGAASEPRAYAAGLLQTDGLEAVDNQYVDALEEVGVFGAALVAASLGWALLRAKSAVIAAGMFMVIAESAVFDVLTWPSMVTLAAIFIGFSAAEHRDAARLRPALVGPRHEPPDAAALPVEAREQREYHDVRQRAGGQ